MYHHIHIVNRYPTASAQSFTGNGFLTCIYTQTFTHPFCNSLNLTWCATFADDETRTNSLINVGEVRDNDSTAFLVLDGINDLLCELFCFFIHIQRSSAKSVPNGKRHFFPMRR